jgi:hypothetical protein
LGELFRVSWLDFERDVIPKLTSDDTVILVNAGSHANDTSEVLLTITWSASATRACGDSHPLVRSFTVTTRTRTPSTSTTTGHHHHHHHHHHHYHYHTTTYNNNNTTPPPPPPTTTATSPPPPTTTAITTQQQQEC